eukprot:gene10657-10728_t
MLANVNVERASPAMARWRPSRWLVPLPGFILLAILTLPPFLYGVYLSVVDVDIAIPDRAVSFVGLANYRELLVSDAGQNAIINTLVLSFSSTACAVIFGLVVAYLIAFFAGRFSGLVVVFVLIPLAVSPVAVALVFSLILDPLYGPVPQVIYSLTGSLIAPTANIYGAKLVIILLQAWQWSPIAVILLLGGIQSLPREPVEAALIDGASLWQIITKVHLPLLRPLLAVTAIFEFILCSQVFAATQLLTNGGPGTSTVDLSLFIYKVGIAESGQVSLAAAGGIVALIMGLLSTALVSDTPATASPLAQGQIGPIGTWIGRILLVLALSIWVGPLYWLVNTALKLKVQIQSSAPVWFPDPITFENLEWVIDNVDQSAFFRSLRVVSISVGVAMLLGPLMAYALSRFKTSFNGQLENWIISTRMTPPAGMIMPFYFLALRTGLMNNELGLIIVYVAINLPLAVWIMLAFLRSMPDDAEEASMIDGCSVWQSFFLIVLPTLKQSIISGGLLVLILAWNEFFIAFVMMSSNITFPVQVGSFLAVGLNPEYGHMAAAGLLLSMPPILIAVIFRKQVMQDQVMQDLVVGIDSSTSATKAIAWDRNGRAVAEGRASIPLSNPQPGYFEQDPMDWWRSTVTALKQLTSQIDPARIAGLAISNQRETFGLFTDAGEAVRPGLVWLDDRATQQQHAFGALFGADRIREITGKPLDVIPCLYRMIWLKEHEPEAIEKADHFAEVHAYLTFRLTGQWLSSTASADPTGMLDMRNGTWSNEVLTAAGLPVRLMPELRRPGVQLGKVTAAAAQVTGLRPETPLIAGGGDGQCAGTGAGVLGAGRGYINLGTAVVAGIYSPVYAHDLGFRTETAISEEGYIFETCLRSGTFLVDWLTREMMGVAQADKTRFLAQIESEAAASPIGAGGVMLLPFWQGSMTPHWDSAARGVIAGLSGSTRRGDLYRALLEGIALDLVASMTKAMAFTGQSVDRFLAIGGGAASNVFLQIIADTLDRPIDRSEANEASSLGAAMAAAKGVGWFAAISEAAAAMGGRAVKTFTPDQGRVAAYRALAGVYDDLWPLLSVWNQRRADVIASLNA